MICGQRREKSKKERRKISIVENEFLCAPVRQTINVALCRSRWGVFFLFGAKSIWITEQHFCSPVIYYVRDGTHWIESNQSSRSRVRRWYENNSSQEKKKNYNEFVV